MFRCSQCGKELLKETESGLCKKCEDDLIEELSLIEKEQMEEVYAGIIRRNVKRAGLLRIIIL